MKLEDVTVKLDSHTDVGELKLDQDNRVVVVLNDYMSKELRSFLDHDMVEGLTFTLNMDPTVVKFCQG